MSNDQNPTLESLFKDLLEKVTSLKSNEENFIFFSKTLPVPPPVLETEGLGIYKRVHGYSFFLADRLEFSGSKEMYGYLGLLTLSVLLHEEVDRVELKLTNPDSHIKQIIIEFEYKTLENLWTGYRHRPFAFKYSPSILKTQHPWYYSNDKIDPYDLPCFYLTGSEDFTIPMLEWFKSRDTILGFGNDEGSARLAELFLNLAHAENDILEINLECEAGFREVGPESAEVRLQLPGSDFYDISD